MNSLYLDLILSGLTYVILTYLSFMLMKKRKSTIDNDDDDGNGLISDQPKIDLPPGVVWPDSPITYKEIPQEVY
ncbi:MAG: hypothetical protein ACI9Z3_000199 [Roseivirga sp.]|jgi:hypothetical protein